MFQALRRWRLMPPILPKGHRRIPPLLTVPPAHPLAKRKQETMNYGNQLPSRVMCALQELAEQENVAVARCAQRARQRLLEQKVGPGEARDQLQLYAMGEASARKRADDYAALAQKGHCPACWVWKGFRGVLSLAMEGGALHATCPACEREWVVQVVPSETALWMTEVSSV